MTEEHKPTEQRQFPWRAVAIAVAVVLLLWFGLANRQFVHVHFWITTRRVRLSFALLVAALLGAAIGFFGARARYRGR
jgi:uncharacterized integral membrane protein